MKILQALKAAFELKGGTSGLKTVIGQLSFVFAGWLATVNDAMPVYPDATFLDLLAGSLEQVLSYLEQAALFVSYTATPLGVLDKVRKFFKGLIN